MQNTAWVDLFRLIPTSRHENLVLTTSAGVEIAVQNVISLGEEYAVIRGRLLGTSEGGGFFIVPFDRIGVVGFHRSVPDDEVRAIFSPQASAAEAAATAVSESPIADSATPAESAPVAAPPAAPIVAPAPARPTTLAAGGAARATAVDKATLLERLRARRASPDAVRIAGQ